MSTTKDRLSALRNAVKTTDRGQTVVKPKSESEKIEIQPLPISVLTAKAFTGTEKMLYCEDPRIEAKFKMLSEELCKESGLSSFTSALFKVDQAIGEDPNVVTQLSVEAIKLYCQASKRLVADPSGSKHVEQIQMDLKNKQTDQLMELLNAGGNDDDDEFDFI